MDNPPPYQKIEKKSRDKIVFNIPIYLGDSVNHGLEIQPKHCLAIGSELETGKRGYWNAFINGSNFIHDEDSEYNKMRFIIRCGFNTPLVKENIAKTV